MWLCGFILPETEMPYIIDMYKFLYAHWALSHQHKITKWGNQTSQFQAIVAYLLMHRFTCSIYNENFNEWFREMFSTVFRRQNHFINTIFQKIKFFIWLFSSLTYDITIVIDSMVLIIMVTFIWFNFGLFYVAFQMEQSLHGYVGCVADR